MLIYGHEICVSDVGNFTWREKKFGNNRFTVPPPIVSLNVIYLDTAVIVITISFSLALSEAAALWFIHEGFFHSLKREREKNKSRDAVHPPDECHTLTRRPKPSTWDRRVQWRTLSVDCETKSTPFGDFSFLRNFSIDNKLKEIQWVIRFK